MKRDAKEGDSWEINSYDELHPGRFLKSSHLDGRPVTLTVSDFRAEHMGKKKDGSDDIRGILSFREIPEQYASQMTNQVLMKAIFGDDPRAPIGKQITLGPSMVRGIGGKMVPGIRIVGAPSLAQESVSVDVVFPVGRGRPKEKHVLRRTKAEPHPLLGDNQPRPEPTKPPGNITEALATIEKWTGDVGPLKAGLQEKSWTKEERAQIKAALEGKA